MQHAPCHGIISELRQQIEDTLHAVSQVLCLALWVVAYRYLSAYRYLLVLILSRMTCSLPRLTRTLSSSIKTYRCAKEAC